MAEYVGTAFAAVQFADQCIKYGQKLVRRIQSYRHAEDEVRGLMVTIEHNWMKTEAQIKFLRNIANKLEPHFRDVQARVLSELEGKLKTATLLMDQLIVQEKEERKKKEAGKKIDIPALSKALETMAPRKKVKYAFEKNSLESIRDDLEAWQRRFDPSWMLTMRIADSVVDQQLDQEESKPQQTKFIMAAKGVRDAARESTTAPIRAEGSIFKPASILSSDETPIEFSPVLLGQLDGSQETVLIDTMVCNPIADMDQTMRDVRKLANILSKVDPAEFGLLNCSGVVKSAQIPSREPLRSAINLTKPWEPPTFKFLFPIPTSLSTPQSLRALLIESNPSYPLNGRLDLAKQLTNSVLFIHSSQFVHKNIRPETTIIFGKEENAGTRVLGNLYLVGFEKLRPAEGMTYRTSDGDWHRDIYRHPSRQGTQPEERYQMQHDIYSLGVVLLELGLWKSFITYSSSGTISDGAFLEADGSKKMSESEQAIPVQPDFIAEHSFEKNTLKRATAIKDHLISVASQELPAKMGQKYADIVLLCLRCLDKQPLSIQDNEDEMGREEWVENEEEEEGEFGDVYDEDGIVVGVKYIEKVLLKMQGISV
ncbi:hypothetical protein FQN54_002763 [Arachnomyces sp. PD_36]|nr:hypothetical protein FQN54_002763 [Arachnomyces sp. PD_36]